MLYTSNDTLTESMEIMSTLQAYEPEVLQRAENKAVYREKLMINWFEANTYDWKHNTNTHTHAYANTYTKGTNIHTFYPHTHTHTHQTIPYH